MAHTLACKNFGVGCPYVAHGETKEESMADGVKHVKEVHGNTDEQVNDPKFIEEAKKMIKSS